MRGLHPAEAAAERSVRRGLGVRYRGEPVVGYANGYDPLFGDSETLVNLLLRREFKLVHRPLQVQANLDNLFDLDDPIVADADTSGGLRYLYPNPRRWSVSITWRF